MLCLHLFALLPKVGIQIQFKIERKVPIGIFFYSLNERVLSILYNREIKGGHNFAEHNDIFISNFSLLNVLVCNFTMVSVTI